MQIVVPIEMFVFVKFSIHPYGTEETLWTPFIPRIALRSIRGCFHLLPPGENAKLATSSCRPVKQVVN